MKLFSEQNGIFQMYIPVEWQYQNPSLYKNEAGAPHTFQLYDNPLGGFQLSCKEVNPHIKKIIKSNRLRIQPSESDELEFAEQIFLDKKFSTYTWMCAVDDYFVFATYIFETKRKSLKKRISELSNVKNALAMFKLVKPQFRSIVAASRRYELFIGSIAANIDLRNKAIKNNSFIELVVLIANHIDAALRLSIIYTNQIENSNDEIDTTYLFQSETDKAVMEREIYKVALDRNIIDKRTFDELELLYKERNKVVHRYIITDIQTGDVLEIARKYFGIDERIDSITNSLERKQFDLKVGIHGKSVEPPGSPSKHELKKIYSQIRDKHGRAVAPKKKKNRTKKN